MLVQRKQHRPDDGRREEDGDDEEVADDDDKTQKKGHGTFKKLARFVRVNVRRIGQAVIVVVVVLFVLVLLLDPKYLVRQVRRKGGSSKRSSSGTSSSSALDKLTPQRESWTLEQYKEDVLKLRSGNLSESEKRKQIVMKKLTVTIPKPYKLHHRSFGCMRDTCRGLEIEDLFDRGFHRYFRSALKNDSANGGYNLKSNYHVTVLLLDTTQLNHMKTSAPQLWKKVWETQASSTYVIAFEGGDAMGGNKGFQLRQKDRFTRQFGCDYDSLRVQPTQYRLYVKSECQALLDRSKRDKTTSFLLKPEAGSQGQGITFHPNADEIVEKRPEFFPCETRHGIQATSRFLVQEYIVKPLLLAKCKFDARVYLFVSSSDPYILWYHRGYLRRSLTPYSPTTRDRKAYLTNTHFQSSRANFNMSEHIWTFDRMQRQLVMQKQAGYGYVESVLEPHIKEIARFIFESARDKIIPRKGSNQIIGLDFMLDDALALHFIEANGYPGFTWSVNFDSRGMVEDMFDLMMEQGEAPSPFRFLRPGDWFGGFQLIHSDVRKHRWPYNPCEKLVDNPLLTKVVKAAAERLYSKSGEADEEDDEDKIKPTAVKVTEPKTKTDEDEEQEEEHPENDGSSSTIDSVIQKFPLSASATSCSNFVAETFNLNIKEDCERFVRRSTSADAGKGDGIGSNIVAAYSSPTMTEAILIPNITSALRLLKLSSTEDCPLSGGKKWIVQMTPEKEMAFQVERVAYPGGRRPLAVFYRDKSLAENNLDKGEDSDMSSGAEFVPKPNDKVFVRAEKVLGLFSSASLMQVTYRIKWFLLILNRNNGANMAWSYPGYAYSVRRGRCPSPSHETWIESEHAMTLDLFQDLLSIEAMTSTHYVSSLLEPTVRRVAQDFVQSVGPKIDAKSLLIGMDFAIDAHTLKPALLRMHPVTADDITRLIIAADSTGNDDQDDEGVNDTPTLDMSQPMKLDLEGIVVRTLKKLQESRSRLERTHSIAPTFFARTRRGDAFERFRLVHSDLELLRFEDLESSDPCGDAFPVPKDLRFAVEFERYALKRKNAMNRDLNKRIVKRWMVCRVKKSDDLKLKCMRNLLQERYRIIVEKNRLVSDEERWINEVVRGLIDYSRKAGPGADEEDERKFGGSGGGRKVEEDV